MSLESFKNLTGKIEDTRSNHPVGGIDPSDEAECTQKTNHRMHEQTIVTICVLHESHYTCAPQSQVWHLHQSGERPSPFITPASSNQAQHYARLSKLYCLSLPCNGLRLTRGLLGSAVKGRPAVCSDRYGQTGFGTIHMHQRCTVLVDSAKWRPPPWQTCVTVGAVCLR